jgi:hypothetical protein
MKNTSSKQEHNMQKTSADSYLKPLETLQAVNAPDFLFARIQQAIASSQMVSRPKLILAGAAFCVVILFNLMLVMRSGRSPHTGSDALVTEVSTNNDIYR